MSAENNDNQAKKKEPRFDRQQFDALMQCSEDEKKRVTQTPDGHRINEWQYMLLKVCATDDEGIKMWNAWREAAFFIEEIFLEGAHLFEAYLKGAGLMSAQLKGASLDDTHLEGADLSLAHLEGAHLNRAHLEGADFFGAYLKGASFISAHLEGAGLKTAHLEDALFFEAHLEGAILNSAHLEGAGLNGAHLEEATLLFAHLESVKLAGSHLEGADFSRAIVNGSTLIWGCSLDRKTKFEGVGLDNARIYPVLKQLLEYNIRRMNWQDWYKGKSENKYIRWMRILLTSPVRLFWWTSNYGLSTLRVIFTFFALAFIFAVAYRRWPDFVVFNGGVKDFQSLLHAFYFSVVTMTTLGFGDIAANPYSWQGQVLLMLQVLLGYILLAALVTRFSVLFTAGGPAGRFSKQPKKPPKKPKKEPPN